MSQEDNSVQPVMDMQEKINGFIANIKPAVFDELPKELGMFRQAFNKYDKMFEVTISDAVSRRQTAIMMARQECPVNSDLIRQAMSIFEEKMTGEINEFTEHVNGKATEKIGKCTTRVKEIEQRQQEIRNQIAALQQEASNLVQETVNVQAEVQKIEGNLTLSKSAFDAACVAIRSEAGELFNELDKMIQ